MTSGIIKPALVFSLFWLAVISCPAQKLRISAIQAKLFYENTGTFSENVLTEKGFDLWNTNFDSTYSTFVIVELEGLPPEPPRRPHQIELTTRYIPFDNVKRSITLRQIEKIRNGSENGKAYAGFWIKNTGCEPVYLTARIIGRSQRFKEMINFRCGE